MSECKHKNRKFSSRYDAYYCADCGEWLESKCGSPMCQFCETRPAVAPLGEKG